MTRRFRDYLQQMREEADAAHDQALVESLTNRLSGAVVVSPDEVMTRRVQFGAKVTVFAIEEQEEQTFEIVSEDEAVRARGLLGCETPLALALYGAQEGDEVEVRLPTGTSCIYEVTAIEAPTE